MEAWWFSGQRCVVARSPHIFILSKTFSCYKTESLHSIQTLDNVYQYKTVLARCNARSASLNHIWIKHPLLWSRSVYQWVGVLRDVFVTSGIQKWIYLHSCLSTWLRQRSSEATSFVVCLRRRENILTAQKTSQRRGGEMKRGNWSLWWVLSSMRVDLNSSTQTHSLVRECRPYIINTSGSDADKTC